MSLSKPSIAERLQLLIDSDPSVPCLPEVAIQLCMLTNNDNARVQELCDLIALDPGLAAACIRMASSVTRARSPIDHLDHAVFLLGVSEIRNMALNMVVIGAFAPMQSRLHNDEFWVHNVCVAKLTHWLAGSATAHGYAYLAGLLHDVGKLIIERHFPEEYSAVLVAALERRGSQFQMERRLLGVDHARIGAILCRRLNIDEVVAEAVELHHSSGSRSNLDSEKAGAAQELAACIAVSDYLVHQAPISATGEVLLSEHLSCLPQWQFLSQRWALEDVRLDLMAAIDSARQEFTALAVGRS